ncbi:MAG: hypothetical protein ACLFTK_12735, partial [Anaerolineales bacterium]
MPLNAMNLFTQDDLRQLLDHEALPSVSLYMPTYRAGAETRQNPIRFKNLMGDAERQLSTAWPDEIVQAVLAPGRRLQQDYGFFEQQSDGLALFMSEDQFIMHQLPLDFPEMVTVSDRFHIKPLVPFWDENGYFFLLAIGQQTVKLYQCTRYTFGEVTLPEDMPRSLDEALQYDQPEVETQYHSGAGSGENPIYHSHDPADGAYQKVELSRYLKQVENYITEALQNETAPLILSGTETTIGLYREANHYPHLSEDIDLRGSPQHAQPQDLHAQAVAK